jgi:hypothetical protein
MQRCLAIALLTWKAAFRFRLFWVLAILLLASVVVLPLLIKDDGTARGFTQILLTYTLTVITSLLGLATLWLACGILAKDIEECQLQMVAAKPIPRWQIWLGKWLGLVLLNLALLCVAGASVYVLLNWRASRLPAPQREVLRKEILVARGSLQPRPPDIESDVQRVFEHRVKTANVPPAEHDALRKQLRELVESAHQVAMPGVAKDWTIDVGARHVFLRDEPLFIRIKFYAARTNATGSYFTTWHIGSPTGAALSRDLLLAANTPTEFAIPPNLFDEQGRLFVRLINRDETTLVVPLADGFEVLYREGGFALNFIRGLLIIACWLALLAAIGLASATFLSFPVAAFVSVSLLFAVFSSGTLANVVSEGTVFGLNHEGGTPGSFIDLLLVPVFRAMLWIINLVRGFSPVDALSTGRSISWWQLARAFGQIVLLMGGLAAVAGMMILTRRELATAQPQV